MQKIRYCNNKRIVYLVLILVVNLFACAPNKIIAHKLKSEFKNSAVINTYQVGFALYDKDKKEMIFQKDADKYYTPASNTKLFTFYAGLKITPDSIPSLRYITRGDSLIFWGTGDPSFLHTTLKGTKAFNFLKSSNKKLFYAPGRYTGDFYGNGWQWDDYNDYYQPEINEFPLMDNVVLITSNNVGDISILPNTFGSCFVKDTLDLTSKFKVIRNFNENIFQYPAARINAN